MKNLYFIRSNGEKRLIRENIDPDKVIGYIEEYVHTINPKYKIYYTRYWEENGGTMYDVGSYTEFFWVGKEKVV